MVHDFQIEGRDVADGAVAPQYEFRSVSTEYFRTMGIPLLRGRFFDDTDRVDGRPVALVNQTLARHYWGEEDPVGRRVSIDRGLSWKTIVGVTGDVKQYGLSEPAVDELYFPTVQSPSRVSNLLVRTTGDPKQMTTGITALVHDIDPNQPVAPTLAQLRAQSLATPRLTMSLLGVFVLLALIITAAGISGVLAFSVSQRGQEFGIRMALGATRGGIVGMVVGQGMGLVLAGVVLGLGGALATTRLMSGLLFEIDPADPLTFTAMAGVISGVALVASWVPARRATSVDPIVALRSE